MTILFADLVGSTALGSRLDPEVLRRVLSSYWSVARAAVERHGGTVEKFIGDAVVGVFGIPSVHEDDALRAVRAAAELLAAVDDLNAGPLASVGVQLAVRIGINTGPVMAGETTGDVALMAGDAANVGARLEQAAAAGEVLLGETTYRLVRDHVEAEPVPPLTVKGKDEPLVAWRLIRVLSAGGQPRRRRFSGPLVGRARHLAQARMAYDTAVEEDACVLLTIVGAPGVGKSRLVEELLSGVPPDAMVVTGRCLPYGEGITYWPVAQMLQRFGDAGTTGWASLLAGVEHAHEIAAGLDTILGRSDVADGSQMAWAFRRLLESLARTGPIVVVLDDLQWAEPAMLDLVGHVTDMSRDAAILVVCMARPELSQIAPAWGAGARHSITTLLAPLTDLDCSALTESLLGRGLDARLLARITSAAEGIPLFVEELVAHLADQGRLEPDGAGEWRAVGDLDDVAVPPTVAALVAARIERLPHAQRVLVDAASVIGKTFYPDLLADLLGPGADAPVALVELVRADVVHPVPTDLPGHDAYAFCHLLVRDAAYEALAKARRADIHVAVARWLGATSVQQVAPELIASHLERAAAYGAELGAADPALADEAAGRLLECAVRAKASGNITGAGGLIASARALVPGRSGTGLAATLAAAELAFLDFDFERASADAHTAELDAMSVGADAARWRARLVGIAIRLETDPHVDVGELVQLTEEAISALASVGDDTGLAHAYLLRCEQSNLLLRWEDGKAAAQAGLRAAHRAKDVARLVDFLHWMLWPYFYSGAPLALEREAFDDLTREFASEPLVASRLAVFGARVQAHEGHLDEAMAALHEGQDLAREQGSRTSVLQWLSAESVERRYAQDYPGVVATLQQILELHRGTGGTLHLSSRLAELAVALARLGRTDEARAALAESRQLSHPADIFIDAQQAVAEGLLLARRGDGERAHQRFDEALALLAPDGSSVDVVDFALARSNACEWLGDSRGALRWAQHGLATARVKGYVPTLRAAAERVAACQALVEPS